MIIKDHIHAMFEEPNAFDSRTRVVYLDKITPRQNSGIFGNDPAPVPPRALIMGARFLMRCTLYGGLISFYFDWVETFVRPSVRLD
ncbi:MAG: hypothetical protein ABF812_15915 [Gluconobacter cerinus]|nr:hypothetical protein [Gluconobacter oxydans]